MIPIKDSTRHIKVQYETYYLFSSNMICLPNIHVCVFISDPFRGHNPKPFF